MDNRKQSILSAIRGVLQYHREIGIKYYPGSSSVRSFMKAVPVAARKAEEKTTSFHPPSSLERKDRRPPAKPLNELTLAQIKANLEEISTEVAGCSACDLHRLRIHPVAGRGNEQAKLLVIGDWLGIDEQNSGQGGRYLFGHRQDVMLSRMLAAIGLSVDQVFITNVIKCAISTSSQPHADHVRSCVSYLRRQIAVIRPDLICTMGMIAARAVLEKKMPLSRLRGKFHMYSVDQQLQIPVLTTYHPTYLLQNAEMKKATWLDLQLVAKKLGLPISPSR
ncbi:uracil-DNA glycosylase [Desulforhopalus singaporensis]|uniref:Type-4 uracil-DNA glycosylase n=1 Tax=Desulforhopalus singaporensis TaxID=91360 RepID=A0A1H0M677_9BACT|nr:uracil-DNA glycosylase [Desulforhopalus singaporensis]SDO75894.1 DNA polymerase [Desulforhopalus singaporensis]